MNYQMLVGECMVKNSWTTAHANILRLDNVGYNKVLYLMWQTLTS